MHTVAQTKAFAIFEPVIKFLSGNSTHSEVVEFDTDVLVSLSVQSKHH